MSEPILTRPGVFVDGVLFIPMTDGGYAEFIRVEDVRTTIRSIAGIRGVDFSSFDLSIAKAHTKLNTYLAKRRQEVRVRAAEIRREGKVG